MKLLEQGVAERAFPGGVLAVGHRGRLAVHACGKLSHAAGAAKVDAETIYDTASLTKPVVTTTLAAMLYEQGQLDISAPVGRYLPEWTRGANAEQRARVTVAHLLAHASGLPAHEDYFLKSKGRAEILARAAAQPLTYEPGSKTIYSDIGFILLGAIIESLTGRGLDELAKERIFAPLGMTNTMFRPPKSLRARIASTERTGARKQLVRGEVHDENAWAMGGVAGHAGMFSTGPDLAIFCQMLLNGGIYAHRAHPVAQDRGGIHVGESAGGKYAHAGLECAHRARLRADNIFRSRASGTPDSPARRYGSIQRRSFSWYC